MAAPRTHGRRFAVIPTPGVAGGANGVAKLDLETGQITLLHVGEPQPTHIVIDRWGDRYCTCTSAGVILEQTEEGTTSVFLDGLDQPSGISVGKRGNVYFSEIPNPGVPGAGNGVSVSVTCPLSTPCVPRYSTTQGRRRTHSPSGRDIRVEELLIGRG